MTRNIEQEIEDLVTQHPVVLFMKGVPEAPACGFSARAVSILKADGVQTIKSVNILEDEEMRQAIKQYSAWPTIPQLYINGVFIGGSDIMLEMHEDGELQKLLEN